ncbi:hypothetical protein GH714_032952 [Hevea brasiliensis]|uniref:Disease resistance R13L4/SHOC-2-like LRR domain-containing protein n=1 Tax=Hevea brasiliensis TaxID=3981 RepID=A0A6A6M7H6_HEVBR|nr:hypothetical protein GH714_032952 [Hevea brasiliensis]
MVRTSTQQIPKSVRHISFPDPESLPNDLPESLQNLDRVRTIWSLNDRHEGISSEVFIKKCVSRFQYMRVLDLTYSRFEVLPTSIGDLKHLKYLSLFGNGLIRRLPNSICKLQSLQVLLLGKCWSLEELPKDIKYMINLRFLWITTNQKYLPTGGIGCLKFLRFLFIGWCDNLEYLFEDMQGLKMLRRLFVCFCRSLTSLPQNIECLRELETLCIDECENLDLAMEEGEDNQFPTQFSLQKLELRNLPKLVEFPQWLIRLIRGSTNSLKVMKVEGCRNLRELPECLQNMASLPEVQIKDCPQLNNDPIRKAGEN